MYDKINEISEKIDGKIGSFIDQYNRNNGSRELLVKKFLEDYTALVGSLKEAENIWFMSEEDLEKIKIYLEQKQRKYILYEKKFIPLRYDVGFSSLNHDIQEDIIRIRYITSNIIYEAKRFMKDMSLKESLLLEMSDESIDLFLLGEQNHRMTYLIFLHGTNICVGDINHEINYEGVFSSKGPDFSFGDIGYNIFPEYRGHNYSLLALSLLSKKLYADGVKEFFITASDDNIPSIKIIEKFGGVFVNRILGGVRYKADLEHIFKNEKSPVRK